MTITLTQALAKVQTELSRDTDLFPHTDQFSTDHASVTFKVGISYTIDPEV